jgi:EmrB/QacA subfamily drug resistance transporter
MFTLGAGLCSIAWNIGALIAFRILQGVGGGMLTPVGVAMLFRAFPPAERARASTVLAIPTVIAPATGPILGGWLVTDVTWRAIFWVNLPIGVLGFLFALRFLKEHREQTAGGFDLWGFLSSGAGLALVLFGLSRAPDDGWTAPNVLVSLIGGGVLFAAMVVVELRRRQPMLDLRLFADRMFRSSNLAYFMVMANLLALFILLTLFLQQLRGYSALQTGLAVFPFSLGTVAISPIVGRLYPRAGPRWLITVGLIGAAVTSALFLLVGLSTPLWWTRGIMYLAGIAFGLCIIPVQASTYATIRSEDTGRASSLFNTNRQVAQSLGVAIVITVLASQSKSLVAAAVRHVAPAARQGAAQHAVLLAFHDAFVAAVVLALLGAGFAFLIHNEDAAATMKPKGERSGQPAPVH